MAKSTQSMFFLFKVVAPAYSKARLRAASTAEMMVTKDSVCMNLAAAPGQSGSIRIGGKPGTVHHGIAGHFTGHYLNFSDSENARCKTLGEAEMLAKKVHHQWLADSYDWFVGQAEVSNAVASTTPKSAAGSTKSAGAKKPARK